MHELDLDNKHNHFECVAIKLDPNEHLHMIVRKHWIILWEVLGLILIIVCLGVGVYTLGRLGNIPSIFTYTTIIGVTMVWLEYTFVRWINDELDVLILTNRRIITLDQVKFLDRKLSQTTIDNVQEVNSSTSWLLGNIFEYGNLMIRTASDTSNENSDFHLTQVPYPIETSRKIHSFIDENRHELDK